ncbi:MAG: DUF1320 domain-containing protein [Gammaproteobacteria bacterium]|nr:DUF1320 domain-containing protein [Gammaproteobacteria bacterium]
MPDYTVTADIYDVVSEKLVAELTDDTAGEDVDTDLIDSALDRAESVVDSYVGKAYTVPLSTPVEDSIKHAVLTLAKCYLYGRRPGATPDQVTKDCEDMIAWLKMISEGDVALEASVGADIAEQGNDTEVFKVQIF